MSLAKKICMASARRSCRKTFPYKLQRTLKELEVKVKRQREQTDRDKEEQREMEAKLEQLRSLHAHIRRRNKMRMAYNFLVSTQLGICVRLALLLALEDDTVSVD
ncbi:hypothetical protein CFOL_v3_12743 [Cephalotus follicularis]|uniref:Uncharacterized protein n=1 Tax=Cephalotus follicularis TaxID=3775 RepID=A0A1Q3BN01_CEPFO|nr:hypothetical protein CFOL_v3_12743 [Cephalotus follicularis]